MKSLLLKSLFYYVIISLNSKVVDEHRQRPSFTMEMPAAAESAGDEYMTMDAEDWSACDDTYENGDTFDLNLQGKWKSGGHDSCLDSKEKRKEEVRKDVVVTRRPQQNTGNSKGTQPPNNPARDRYITIRRPPKNGPGVRQPRQLVIYRSTTVCLLLLCLLLLGGLLGLSFHYVRLNEINMEMRENLRTLKEENQNLSLEICNLKQIARSIYQVSSTDTFDFSTAQDLYVLNHKALEEQMQTNSFLLSRTSFDDKGGCYLVSFNCTSASPSTYHDGC